MSPAGASCVSFMSLEKHTCAALLDEFKRHLQIADAELSYSIENEWEGFAPQYEKDHYTRSLNIVKLIKEISDSKINVNIYVLL
jgi:protoporphyrinogen oxidase